MATGRELRIAALGTTTLLAACGGGGGGIASTPPPPVAVVMPTPAPTPTPAPAPVSTTTPATGNDTSEYRATVGAVNMNALAAYNAGATGAGVGLAIIDSGIDLQSAEFDDRISTASRAFAGSSTVDDEGGHGTAVAFTAAGRRNGSGTHGVAFGATVIAERVDRPGSCASASTSTDDSAGGCKFGTDAIGASVDAARTAGARVINISLGGSAMPQALQAAIGRATAAGIVVVIAAGNDGTDNPDPFTDVANGAYANGAVIVAGSVGAGGAISSFSDKAGTGAATYLAAVGERVRAPDQTNTPYIWSGTSFAAPQIAGAVALLAQAFPNLTGAQIVNLLLTTARDAGAAGTDPIYGRGILDLTRAFQPVGTATVAGASAAVSTGTNGYTSAAMGDARSLGVGAVILDGYSRAFGIDLAQTIARSRPAQPLLGALAGRTRQSSFAVGGTAVAMTLAPARNGMLLGRTSLTTDDANAARAIAGTVTQALGRHLSFGFGYRQGAAGLSAQLAGRSEPAFLIADGAAVDNAAGQAGAVRRQVGRWGVTAAAESGAVMSPREALLPGARQWERTPYTRIAIGLDRQAGPVSATASVSRLAERATVLGARFDAALGAPSATSWFLDAGARATAAGWTVGATLRSGWTQAQVHGFVGGGRLRSTAWSADIGHGALGLRIAQPLRVGSGGVDLTLPTLYDYATGGVATWTSQRLGLAPQGRELDVEARYAVPLAGGAVQGNLYWRRNPGNIAAAPADTGAALRWSLGF